MFDKNLFTTYAPDEIPKERDCLLMDSKHMADYERFEIEFNESADGCPPSYNFSVIEINGHSIELSWVIDQVFRFHYLNIALPKDKLLRSVECWKNDGPPVLFVDGEWLNDILTRTYSIFCWIDAVGVENAIEKGSFSENVILNIREGVDKLAKENPEFLFLSFADNVLIKGNWNVPSKNSKHPYNPEKLLVLLQKIKSIYKNNGLCIYAILTQGHNLYSGDLFHSEQKNHFCLNSLGAPFAEIFDIENAAKSAFKKDPSPERELYMDSKFYLSLNPDRSSEPEREPYKKIKLSKEEGFYYYSSLEKMLDRLGTTKQKIGPNTNASLG